LPCERSLDWGNPAPNEVCRDQGQLCSDMQKHVVFPICDKTILEKVVPVNLPSVNGGASQKPQGP